MRTAQLYRGWLEAASSSSNEQRECDSHRNGSPSIVPSLDKRLSTSPHQELIGLLIEAEVERAEAAVLLCLHSTKAGFSSQIQLRTGLSQTDVRKATCRLSERGLIEHELGRGSGPGRPRKRYRALDRTRAAEYLIQGSVNRSSSP